MLWSGRSWKPASGPASTTAFQRRSVRTWGERLGTTPSRPSCSQPRLQVPGDDRQARVGTGERRAADGHRLTRPFPKRQRSNQQQLPIQPDGLLFSLAGCRRASNQFAELVALARLTEGRLACRRGQDAAAGVSDSSTTRRRRRGPVPLRRRASSAVAARRGSLTFSSVAESLVLWPPPTPRVDPHL